LIRTPQRTEMLYARQKIVTTACAYGLQAIDLVCVDYQNMDILKEECREGREFGFSGKQAIHPGQIEVIQEYFLPDPKGLSYYHSLFNYANSC
jgi:citrate lyase subunit beta-like protein